MVTGATLFTGGGGADLGMRAAGVEVAWGIEYDPAIADVARANGVPVTVMDVLDADPMQFERVDLLHASPPCPNFSTAKADGRETQHDVDLAGAVCRFIVVLTPDYVTLENVYQYRRSRSFKRILAVLRENGYWYTFEHVNAADYGVPQTRRRLILRAVRHGLVPPLPAPEEWHGWHGAIEDLVGSLPESKFAPWQMRRLCSIGGIHETMMVDSAGFPDATGGPRVPVMRGAEEPVNTVVANYGRRPMRAFLVGGQYGKPAGPDGLRPPQTAWSDEPDFTVTAVNKGDWRAWLERGRVVQMTPRALARFQTFPDGYELPDTNTLAARVIGNAVPARMYQKIAGQLVGSADRNIEH